MNPLTIYYSELSILAVIHITQCQLCFLFCYTCLADCQRWGHMTSSSCFSTGAHKIFVYSICCSIVGAYDQLANSFSTHCIPLPANICSSIVGVLQLLSVSVCTYARVHTCWHACECGHNYMQVHFVDLLVTAWFAWDCAAYKYYGHCLYNVSLATSILYFKPYHNFSVQVT